MAENHESGGGASFHDGRAEDANLKELRSESDGVEELEEGSGVNRTVEDEDWPDEPTRWMGSGGPEPTRGAGFEDPEVAKAPGRHGRGSKEE